MGLTRVPVALAVALAPSSGGKVVRSLRARRGLLERIAAQAKRVRDARRPLVWLHAPSVGEGLQARPVAHALREAHPDWQIAYTFFSPSAERFAASVGADITDYLPFDTAANADALLDALRPAVLVFAKLDVWPTLVARAARRGIPVVMISATLSARSGRRGWWSRQLLHDAYAALSAVGAIDATNAARLIALGARPDAVSLTGDTRFDQVAARAHGDAVRTPAAADALAALASTRPTVVAGSTWPADEAVLFAAWRLVLATRAITPTSRPRLLIAPHEPTPDHCAPIVAWAAQERLTLVRLSDLASGGDAANADVVLVDRVGVLGDLYALASVAYIGGGFHRAGLHSVIEAAAFGVPALFGPQHTMSREAGLLIAAEGAHAVDHANDLAARVTHWLTDAPSRQWAGEAARALVAGECGATARSVELIERAMTR